MLVVKGSISVYLAKPGSAQVEPIGPVYHSLVKRIHYNKYKLMLLDGGLPIRSTKWPCGNIVKAVPEFCRVPCQTRNLSLLPASS
jgi:hypothetical protein